MNRTKFSSTFARLILGAISLCSTLALGTQTATAQAIIVTTPAFSAGSQSFPAGTYQFTRLSEWSLSIRNLNGGGEKLFMVRPEETRSPESHGGQLIFRDSVSNSKGQRILEAVSMPGRDTAAELLQHGPAKKTKYSISLASVSASSGKTAAEDQNAMGR